MPSEATSVDRWRVAFSILGQVLFYDSHRDLIRLVLAGEDEPGFLDPVLVAAHITRIPLASLGLAPPLGRAAKEMNGRRPAVWRPGRIGQRK